MPPTPRHPAEGPGQTIRPGALGVEAAAQYIGMSVSWLQHSDVPRVKLGRRVLYRTMDLDRYLAQRTDLDVAS
jgi:3-hydroxymyristoyl/3-hydroxydecanoyl-(acyl carrier protein) dehydratase